MSAWDYDPEERKPAPGGRMGVIWEGPFRSAHSYSIANRQIVLALLRVGKTLDRALRPRGEYGPDYGPRTASESAVLRGLTERQPPCVQAHVRHFWPPDLHRPPRGRFVLMQPWEYSCLPAEWMAPLERDVDEVWVPSTFVRRVFVSSGCPPGKVHVIPFGVDAARFKPEAPPSPLTTHKGYRFLFVGGAGTTRKGFDILLAAYTTEFRDSEDVCLVVKDSFYGSVEAWVQEARARPHCPEILYLYGHDTAAAMPGYYTACHCYVHPYRGEGFGLPILEAMACGLPVVVTGYGPVLDYCDDSCAVFLRYAMAQSERRSVGSIPTVDYPCWPEPDVGHLREVMRKLYQDRNLGARMGLAGSKKARSSLTWAHSAAGVFCRLRAIGGLLS